MGLFIKLLFENLIGYIKTSTLKFSHWKRKPNPWKVLLPSSFTSGWNLNMPVLSFPFISPQILKKRKNSRTNYVPGTVLDSTMESWVKLMGLIFKKKYRNLTSPYFYLHDTIPKYHIAQLESFNSFLTCLLIVL